MTVALDLDSSNVFECDLTVKQARESFDGISLPEEVEVRLDEAQGAVHDGRFAEAFVVIRIVP